MRSPFCVLLAWTCALQLPAGAAEKWLRLTSKNFELFTTAGEKKGRDAILYFEQVRSFFMNASQSKNAPGGMVRIVAFSSDKEYKPYSPNEAAAAFYQAGPDRDSIVMSSISSEKYPMAIHEYTHLIVKHSGWDLPIWLNEGLADLYSSLQPLGSKMAVGMMLPGRIHALQSGKWIDLAVLTAIDRQSPFYNERDRAGVFYAESWAFTHMLSLSDAYRPRFSELEKSLATGRPVTTAFQEVYGKSLAQVQTDLQQYLKSDRLKAALFDTKLDKSAERPAVESLSAMDAELALAEIVADGGKHKEAEAIYQRLANEHPSNADVQIGLARVASYQRQRDAAIEHYARAVQLGSANAKAYFEYAVLLRGSTAGGHTAEAMLAKSVELNPEDQEAQLYFGFELMQARKYEQAMSHFRRVKRVAPEQASSYFQALAHAFTELGQPDQARAAAEKAKQASRTPEETARSEQILDYVNRRAASPGGFAKNEPSQIEYVEAPRLRRAAPTGETEKAPPMPQAALRLEGVLKQVDCLGKTARLQIVAKDKTVALLIPDPGEVVLKNSTSDFNFACGPQKPLRLTVEYTVQPDVQSKTAGVIRSIEFGPN